MHIYLLCVNLTLYLFDILGFLFTKYKAVSKIVLSPSSKTWHCDPLTINWTHIRPLICSTTLVIHTAILCNVFMMSGCSWYLSPFFYTFLCGTCIISILNGLLASMPPESLVRGDISWLNAAIFENSPSAKSMRPKVGWGRAGCAMRGWSNTWRGGTGCCGAGGSHRTWRWRWYTGPWGTEMKKNMKSRFVVAG